jgi:dihydroceramidase
LVEDRAKRRYGCWLPAALACYAAVLTALTALNRGGLQFFLFQAGFGSLEIYSLGRVWLLQRRSTNAALRNLYRWGMVSYALAVAVWFVDLKACAWLHPNPQLHALWHVGVSVGFFLLLTVIAMARLDTLGVVTGWRLRAGFIPEIVQNRTPR